MNTRHLLAPRTFSLALLSMLGSQVSTAFAQGSLTPPGVPGPTMKTLGQVEPRAPISSLPFLITNPGSYYLTTNLIGTSGQSGITISNSDVTLDLGGFALTGVSGSQWGVYVPAAQTNLVVRNGAVRGWGLGGVGAGAAWNSQFFNLQLSHNGGIGLSSGQASLVSGCTAVSNTAYGLYSYQDSRVLDCVVRNNASTGLYLDDGGSLHGCTANSNGGDGIRCGNACAVSECVANGNSGTGIKTGSGVLSQCTARNNLGDGFQVWMGTVSGCTAEANGGWGVYNEVSGGISSCVARANTNGGFRIGGYGSIRQCTAASNLRNGIQIGVNTLVLENMCTYNGWDGRYYGAGIFVEFYDCRLEGNHLAKNDHGIFCTNSVNFIVRNTARGNSTNYVISGTQVLGPIVTATGIITTNNPWANFSY